MGRSAGLMRVFVDTNVFVYAIGKTSPYRDPCRLITGAIADGGLVGESSVDLLQELVHQRLRQTGDRRAAVDFGRDVTQLVRLHATRAEDMPLAFTLFQDHPRLDLRDATFAAVALRVGLFTLVSADSAFDGVPGLTRVDPGDPEAVADLLG